MKVSSPCNRNIATSNTTLRDIDQPSLLDCTTAMNNHVLSNACNVWMNNAVLAIFWCRYQVAKDIDVQTNTSSISARWFGFEHPHLDITYEIAVGSQGPNTSDVTGGFENVGNVTSYHLENLQLEPLMVNTGMQLFLGSADFLFFFTLQICHWQFKNHVQSLAKIWISSFLGVKSKLHAWSEHSW